MKTASGCKTPAFNLRERGSPSHEEQGEFQNTPHFVSFILFFSCDRLGHTCGLVAARTALSEAPAEQEELLNSRMTYLQSMGFGKDGKGVILMEARSQALGALSNGSGILIGTKLAITDSFRMLKAIGHFGISGLTTQEGSGLLLYLANGNLSLAEAEAKIELSGPLDRSARPEVELAERFVKLVGVTGPPVAGLEQVVIDAFSNAPVIVTKPRWTFGATDSWNWILYNHGQNLTTGATISIRVEDFGVWVGA